MRTARLLTILLLAATVLVDAVVSSVVAAESELPPGWSSPAVVLLESLVMSQVSLVAIWAAFGGVSLPWRVIALILAIGAWNRVIAGATGEWTGGASAFTSVGTVLLCGQAAGIVAPLLLARARGLRLVWIGDAGPPPPGLFPRPPLQFSLGYLLAWMTALAVGMGVLRYTFDSSLLPTDRGSWRDVATIGLSNAVLALAALWAVLGTRRARRWAFVLGGTALTTVATITIVPTVVLLQSATFWLLQTCWLLPSLWVFRVAGYRLAARR